MVRFLTRTLVGVAAAGAVVAGRAQDPSTFRAGTDLVTVDVSVEQHGRPVAGLTSADFIVTDNRVRQDVDAVSTESIPANVTLLVDTGASMSSTLEALKADLSDAMSLLRRDDQKRLLACSAETALVFPMQPARNPVSLDGLAAAGRCPLFDAIALSLFRKRPPDRGELVVAFASGRDGGSSMSLERVRNIARRSEAVLHVVIVRPPGVIRACQREPWACHESDLRKLAESTGGRLIKQAPNAKLPRALQESLDDLHTSYTVRYTAHGVPRTGWHDISVTLARAGSYTIRARRGYQGG